MSPENRGAFAEDIRAEYGKIRESRASRATAKKIIPLEAARDSRVTIKWDGYSPPRPQKLGIEVEAQLVDDRVRIVAVVRCEGKTGVEMEAMTAAAVAALTVYDMVKSAGKGVEIGPVRLLEKSGGKSGQWKRGCEDGQG